VFGGAKAAPVSGASKVAKPNRVLGDVDPFLEGRAAAIHVDVSLARSGHPAKAEKHPFEARFAGGGEDQGLVNSNGSHLCESQYILFVV
jgi:hypothetical protein